MRTKQPAVRRCHIPAEGRFETRPLRIVHLSDLHNTLYGPEQEILIRIVRAEFPDLILVTGDMFDDRRPHKGAMLLYRGLRDLAPMYAVTGNHEYDPGVIIRLRLWLSRLGVPLLEDRWTALEVRGERVLLAGVRDPIHRLTSYRYNQEERMASHFSSLWQEEGYRILLAHHPERIHHYLDYPFDLVLTGHAHGGQVRIPFTQRGLYAPHQGILPSYTRGVYAFGGCRMVVSCGLSRFATLPRVLNPPEVVVLTVGGRQR